MRLFLIIILLALTSAAAKADATLTCTLTGAGAANTSVPLVIADGDGVRVLAVAVKAYSPWTVPPVIPANDARCATTAPQTPDVGCSAVPPTVPADDPRCATVVPHTPEAGCFPTQRQATNREAITALLRDMLNSTLLGNVRASEQAAAAKTAADAVVPITPK